MRYCSHCKRLNTEHPPFCRYCGRSWNARLCPRGHPNPTDANFCGECGNTDLTETTGSFPLWVRAAAWASGGFALLVTAAAIARSSALAEVFRAIICLAITAIFMTALFPKATMDAMSDVLLFCLKAFGHIIRFFLFGTTKSRGKQG